jgi:cytochrome c1
MRALPSLRRHLAFALATLMFVLTGPIETARAALITTEQAIEATAAEGDRERVKAFLARDDVRTQMVALGVDPVEAANRVAGLSDAEVRQIAGHLDQLPAGQNAIAAVIGAALFIFLVLLITDLLGLTDVFPFVRHR